METVGDVMESIKDLNGLIKFVNDQANMAREAGRDRDVDAFVGVSMALGDYISALKRMKLKEAI